MKSYEASHGLAYVLEGNWGSFTDHSSDFGCHFGFNSFLDYGAEFMCLELSPIHEVWALSGYAERKVADADWKAAFSEQHVSLYNSSTRLVPNNAFEGSILNVDVGKNDMEASTDSSILYVAAKTEMCSHARQSRPKRVSMTPVVDFRETSFALQRDNLLFSAAKGHKVVGSPLNKNWVEISKDAASRLMSPCSPPWPENFCLASLPCDEKMGAFGGSFLDVMASQTASTDVILPESQLGVNKSTLCESAPSITNLLICKQADLMESCKGSIDVADKEIEMLGKALCYAQTRARLAENLVEQTLKERDKLEQLFIRETWTSYTYRQRALSLEVENRFLKLCFERGSQLWSNNKKAYSCKSAMPSPSNPGEKQTPSLNSKGSHECSPNHDKKRNKRKGVSVSFALGFAFVLGLSSAGAGIVIIWTVSWMLFS